VGLAQALIGSPPVLILDEPTVGLDPRQIIEIRQMIKELGREHTILLSTHILPEVSMVCERVIIINQGRIAAQERLDQLTGGRTLEDLFMEAIAGDAAAGAFEEATS
jgi:ABC-2 type transport system ATP-binding protein